MADYHDLIAKVQQADRDRRNAEARKEDEAAAKRQRKIDADKRLLDEHVAPFLEKAFAACRDHNLPVFMSKAAVGSRRAETGIALKAPHGRDVELRIVWSKGGVEIRPSFEIPANRTASGADIKLEVDRAVADMLAYWYRHHGG